MTARLFPLALFFMLLVACSTDFEADEDPRLVVEGWIDSDGHPVVILTTTVPISEERKSLNNLGDYIVRWARVTVSDGEEEAVLTGKLDRRYFPPYIYTTSRIRGKVGHTYRMTASYKDFYAEAETTIPEPMTLDSLRVKPCENNDTLWQLHGFFHDDLSVPRYYKFFVSRGRRSLMPLSSYMQTVSNEVFAPDEEIDVSIYKGRLVTERDTYIPYFTSRDTLLVRFVTMDETSFRFWNQMEHNMTLAKLPMASAKNPISNVRGALGYWCGYGTTFYPVVIADSIK